MQAIESLKVSEPLAALLNNLFQVSAALSTDVFTIVCAGNKFVLANRGTTIDAACGLVMRCAANSNIFTHMFCRVGGRAHCVFTLRSALCVVATHAFSIG